MDLTPKKIVEELDKYIIGQSSAKRAVAVALRNRYRRSRLSPELKDEITPKNIIMKGPTGVGKTEIARRLAKLVAAPFLKVEATKFTEVGYVGRDVDSMARDLVEVAVRMVREEKINEVSVKANDIVEKRLADLIFNAKKSIDTDESDISHEQILLDLRAGKYDKDIIEIDAIDSPKSIEMLAGGGGEINIGDVFGGLFPSRKKRKKMTLAKARELLKQEESSKLIDLDSVNAEGIKRAEEEGIIFIDEIDKIIGSGTTNGPDVSREGVQRDILPLVEGSTVMTKYGTVKTDYVLFIAAGAFHFGKIEDLIPELQGRFPIRVELTNLTKADFVKILTQPKNALTLQYSELLKTDNIDLEFMPDAIDEIALLAERENETSENIGARRLHTIMEQLLEDISFNATGENPMTAVKIDREYVQKVFSAATKKYDLSKFVL